MNALNFKAGDLMVLGQAHLTVALERLVERNLRNAALLGFALPMAIRPKVPLMDEWFSAKISGEKARSQLADLVGGVKMWCCRPIARNDGVVHPGDLDG
jgi:hypothetical protein